MEKNLEEKLGRLISEEKRLEQFNEVFHKVLRDNAKNSDYELIGEDGVVNIENLKRITDRIGTGSIDFYRKERNPLTNEIAGRCVRIPSKDMLLLISVCLELDADTVSSLLLSAGYSNYVKNLKEFIIYCGLNNIKSVDEISAKLFQHGYREQDALMPVAYKDHANAMESFSAYFDALCAAKALDKKEVLERAGLISPIQDPEINQYYNSAFYGQKAVKITLRHDQAHRLFTALGLDYEEKTAYLDFLLKLGIISEDDAELLLAGVKEDISRAEMMSASSKYPDIGDNSVFTQYLSAQLDNLRWEQLDDFIRENFGTIRSFAVFYEQLIRYEGYKNVSQFCSAFSLSAKSHYNYVAGVSLPTLSTLTATAFLFKKMTVQIYNTILKKAGKQVFDCDDDSAVYLLAKELLLAKKTEKILFGDLFDWTERFVFYRQLSGPADDLRQLYPELCKILSRHLSAWLKLHRIELGDETLKALRAAQEQSAAPAPFSAVFRDVVEAVESAPGGVRGKAGTLMENMKEKFGFSDDSVLFGGCRDDIRERRPL